MKRKQQTETILVNDGETQFDMPVGRVRLPPLNRIFRFSAHDLKTNQQGKLSPRQHQRVYQYYWKQMPRDIWLVLGALLVLLILSANDAPWLTVIIMLVMVTILSFQEAALRAKLKEAEQSGVQQVTGRISKQGDQITIGDVSFHLKPRQINALQDGERYTIYYFRQPVMILSIERTDASKK